MSYDASETGIQTGTPVELYTIESSLWTYRFTSYDEDVAFGGITFASIPISRGQVEVSSLGNLRELTLTMPADHEMIGRLRSNGIPVRGVRLTISRYHVTAGVGLLPGVPITRNLWHGEVSTIESDEQYARIRVPLLLDEQINVHLPIARGQRTCNHRLYSTGCGIARHHLFCVTPTVLTVSGVTLVVSSMSGQADGWAKHGEVVRLYDGERRSILEQVGTTLTLDMPFAELDSGDAIEVWAGCNWLVETCRDKFNNVVNFGGHPHFPESNPTAPSGYGVIAQV